MIFTGSSTALVTPFNADFSINYEHLASLIAFQISQGTKALVILGTTAETPALSEAEQVELMTFAIKEVNGRLPVIFGTGSNNTQTVIRMTQFAQTIGAAGALIVNPYYNKSTQAGIIAHYEAILEATNLPIILYNVPSRTGCNMEVETIKKLKTHPRIVGIKQATNNLSEWVSLCMLIDDQFKVYVGNDDMIFPALALGASGVVSVLSNIIPKRVSNLCQLFFDGQIDQARAEQYALKPLADALFTVTNPIPVKSALHLMGKTNPTVRLPLIPLDQATSKDLAALLSAYELR